uniref:Uncharacterized protein n=1 Tax=Caenorhabditis japonica TaxID=281687 RepID=A0A8R1I8E6_CAEJA
MARMVCHKHSYRVPVGHNINTTNFGRLWSIRRNDWDCTELFGDQNSYAASMPVAITANNSEVVVEGEKRIRKRVIEKPVNEWMIYRRSKAEKPPVKKSYLLIFARLGPIDMDDPSAVELIARITATDAKKLIVEPCYTDDVGIQMETKFGDFSAKIRIEDREKSKEDGEVVGEKIGGDGGRKSRRFRPNFTNLPEAEHFVTARDGLIESVVNVSLVKAFDLLFDEGLTIDYQLRIPAGVSLKSENPSGRSQRYSADENGQINLDYILEFTFESPRVDVFPLFMMRIMAVDYWGRQYIAGYGCAHISLQPGRLEIYLINVKVLLIRLKSSTS